MAPLLYGHGKGAMAFSRLVRRLQVAINRRRTAQQSRKYKKTLPT